MRTETWLDEDIALLQRLWADGETATVIARKLGGISRSAVLGKVFRLRLGAAGSGKTKDKATTAKTARMDKSLQRRRGAEPEPAPAAKERRARTLHELTNRCCRWPYKRPGTEKYFFCGVEEADLAAGIPYCARHMKRAYLIPPLAATPLRALKAPAVRRARPARAA